MENYDEVLTRIKKIYRSSPKKDQKILLQILQEISDTGESETYENIWLQDYKEIPVDIDTFLTDDLYLGKTNRNGDSIYPHWRKVMREIFSSGNQYDEVVFTGATRIGKSTTAVSCIAYMLYKLMCLRDPQEFFGKKDISKFSILFFNVTLDLAKGVMYREFNDTLKESPWFNKHGTFSKSQNDFYYIPEGGKVVIETGSGYTHALGQQVYCCAIDEINFAKTGIKDVNKAKENIRETYNALSARVKGTFRMGGEVYGKMFAVSSKKSDQDFMEDYVQEQVKAGAGDHMYVDDCPQWEVLPKSMFHSETFPIAVGDRHHKGFVVPDGPNQEEAIQELIDQGYKIMYPPIDMKPNFLSDFGVALRDLAGIAVPGALSFITQLSLTQCIHDRRNPFYNDIVQIGTQDKYTLEEFFHQEVIDNNLKNAPMFIHLDLSLNTDKTGISGVSITGRKDMDVDGNTMSFPTFTHIFSVALEAPRGDKIPYPKITAFIVWLRNQHFNISGITRDQFQSDYMAQLLEAQGFGEVKKLSLDRTPDGYMALRSVLLEHRIDMLDCRLLQDELIHLQRDSITQKIDHPVGGCFTGYTKVSIENGKSISIYQLLEDQSNGIHHEVITYNEQNKLFEMKNIRKVFYTKHVDKIIRVALTNDEEFQCTPEHRFLMIDGTWKEMQDITSNDYLMPFDRLWIQIKYKEIIYQEYDVYDIEVEDNHNFILDGGLIAHNSKDVADSFAGAVWNAILTNPGVLVPTNKLMNAISSVNGPKFNSNKSTLPSIFVDNRINFR